MQNIIYPSQSPAHEPGLQYTGATDDKKEALWGLRIEAP
jgi:hypothetical protein